MRKFFALAAFCIAISFASCGNHSGAEVAVEDSLRIDTVATLDQSQTIENVAASLTDHMEKGDAAAVKKIIEEVKEQILLLVETGDNETAAQYVAKVQGFVEENKDKLQEIAAESTVTMDDIITLVKELSIAAGQKVEDNVDSTPNDTTQNAKK